jgi:hypothetical protein
MDQARALPTAQQGLHQPPTVWLSNISEAAILFGDRPQRPPAALAAQIFCPIVKRRAWRLRWLVRTNESREEIEMAQDQNRGGSATDVRGPMTGGVDDDLEGGTTGTTSMTGGDWSDASTGQPGGPRSDAAPGGKSGGAAGEDMGPIRMESVGGSPAGESGGGTPGGPASNGSFGSGTYNERGNVTGPDSPAGTDVELDASGQGQGDDLANRLGGGAGRGTGMTGAGAATGDLDSNRSERTDASALSAAGAGGPDAGSPGGMGGARASGGTGTGRPPGGVSPMQIEQGED